MTVSGGAGNTGEARPGGVGASFTSALTTTASSSRNASVVPDLLEQIEVKVRRFTGDGAYDRRLVYDTVAGGGTADVVVVVPPRRSAVPDKNVGGAWSQRSTHLERIEMSSAYSASSVAGAMSGR